jgi:hypothetical protein
MALPLSVQQNMPKSGAHLKGTGLRAQMPPGKPRLLSELLAGKSLASIVERAAESDALARRVQAALPTDVAAHVCGANLRDERLIVIVDGAVWAARVRFEVPALGRSLREGLDIELSGITVKVRPGLTSRTRPG